ncbi:mucin-4-like, partial [Saccoglossus kowalevskii]
MMNVRFLVTTVIRMLLVQMWKGSYNCTCVQGYRGDGRDCKEIILFPYGDNNGDVRLTEVYDESYSDGKLDIVSQTITPPAGFPFWGNFYYSLYFTDNGLFTFINENSEKYTHPNPYEGGFTVNHTTPMVAIFWDDVDMTH